MNPFDFVDKMNKIAEHNCDEFKIRWQVTPARKWCVTVRETCDKTVLAAGTADTPEEACQRAWDELPRRLAAWEYEMPEGL